MTDSVEQETEPEVQPKVLCELAEVFLRVRREFGGDITDGSAQRIQVQSEAEADAVKALFMRADMASVAACDFARGVGESLATEVQVFTSFTLARSCLESALTVLWLLDSTGGRQTQFGRLFDLRFDELQEGLKLANAIETGEMRDLMSQLLAGLASKALELGIPPRLDRNGRLIGYGDDPATTTALCLRFLGSEGPYRFLSSVTHGASWALRRAGLMDGEPQPLFRVPMLVPQRTAEAGEMLVGVTARCLVPAIDIVAAAHGWDHTEFRRAVEEVLERANMWVDWNQTGESQLGWASEQELGSSCD